MVSKKGLVFSLFFLIALSTILSCASAEIVFSQLKTVYNLGDDLSSQVTITTINPGYLDINLICGGIEKNLYHNVPDSKIINLKRTLIPAYIEDLFGNCYLSGVYGDEKGDSSQFKISNEVRVNLETVQQIYDAGNTAIIKGKAIKENGVNINGFIEISLDNETKLNDLVKDGSFNTNFNISEKTHAGNYSLIVRVYDKDAQDNLLNFGEASLEIQINQKPSKIELAVDSVSLTPGNNLTIIPFLYDMAGDMMNRSLMLQIKDSKDNIVYENIINSNSEFVLETKTNLTAGDLKITSQKDEVIAEKNINVLELKKINVRIVNQTIILENVGNVPYNQIMQFQIGNESVMKEVALSLNETKEYDVSAPDGTYDINIKDDSAEFFSGSGISMTGNVISIEEAGARITNFITEYPAVWIFLLLVVIGFFFSMFRRYQLTRFLGPFHEKKNLVRLEEKRGGMRLVVPKKEKLEEAEFTEKPSYKKIDSVKVKDIKTNESVEKINIHGGITKAEQAGVLHGQKQPVSVIALKIKSGKPTGMAKENIQKALEYAYDAKGASYISGDYILVLFSQIVTKNKNNEAIAIKAAQEMEKFLATHNRKFRDELEYGIGVNSGDLITKVENNTLKFVSIDKTLAIAKKIAEMSSGEVLLSKDIHLKTATTIKTEKIQTGDTEAFKIKRVVDTQASEKFIKDFLRRN